MSRRRPLPIPARRQALRIFQEALDGLDHLPGSFDAMLYGEVTPPFVDDRFLDPWEAGHASPPQDQAEDDGFSFDWPPQGDRRHDQDDYADPYAQEPDDLDAGDLGLGSYDPFDDDNLPF